jgi:predicted amidohydrolase
VTSIAVLQRRTTADLEENRVAVADAVRRAAGEGAAILVAPEAAQAPFPSTAAEARAIAESLDGPFVEALRRASEAGVAVVAGMFEAGPAGEVFNTAVLIDGGEVVGAYRKIHLFDAFGGGESTWATAGPPTPLRAQLGGLHIGVLTCYDLRFPELSQALTAEGVDLLCVPAAWWAGALKAHELDVLTRARAIEGTCALALADQPGPQFCGGSRLLDHRGVEVTALGPSDEGLAIGAIDLAAQAEHLDLVPSRAHRRFKVVPR